MRTWCRVSFVALTFVVAATSANAQSVKITNSGYSATDPKGFWVSGTYTLGREQTVNYVMVKWYLQDGQNLVYKAMQTLACQNGIWVSPGGPYPVPLDTTDGNGVKLKYTAIAYLYVVGNNNYVASDVKSDISAP